MAFTGSLNVPSANLPMARVRCYLLGLLSSLAVLFSLNVSGAVYCLTEEQVASLSSGLYFSSAVEPGAGAVAFTQDDEYNEPENSIESQCTAINERLMTEAEKTSFLASPQGAEGTPAGDQLRAELQSRWYVKTDVVFNNVVDGVRFCTTRKSIRWERDPTPLGLGRKYFPAGPGDQALADTLPDWSGDFSGNEVVWTISKKPNIVLGRIWLPTTFGAAGQGEVESKVISSTVSGLANGPLLYTPPMGGQLLSGEFSSSVVQFKEYVVVKSGYLENYTQAGAPQNNFRTDIDNVSIIETGGIQSKTLALCGGGPGGPGGGGGGGGTPSSTNSMTESQMNTLFEGKLGYFRTNLLGPVKNGILGEFPENSHSAIMMPSSRFSEATPDVDFLGGFVDNDTLEGVRFYLECIIKWLVVFWLMWEARLAIARLVEAVTGTPQLTGSTIPLVSEGIAVVFAGIMTAAVVVAVASAWEFLNSYDFCGGPGGIIGLLYEPGSQPGLLTVFLRMIPMGWMLGAVFGLTSFKGVLLIARTIVPMAIKFFVS